MICPECGNSMVYIDDRGYGKSATGKEGSRRWACLCGYIVYPEDILADIANSPIPKHKSRRLQDWEAFSAAVAEHIATYTTSQYGDKGDDQCTDYTCKECVTQTKKYCDRHGKNMRYNQDALDLIKGAHYLQMAWDKLLNN